MELDPGNYLAYLRIDSVCDYRSAVGDAGPAVSLPVPRVALVVSFRMDSVTTIAAGEYSLEGPGDASLAIFSTIPGPAQLYLVIKRFRNNGLMLPRVYFSAVENYPNIKPV